MAKQRMINTRFWDDDYTSNLDPIEKLLFLYFLTNTSTNICGIYEIPLKKIANETGVDKDMVIKILDRFARDGKIFYFEGWLCLKNFVKHQNQNSPKIKVGIENELMTIPKTILDKMIGYGYGIDTLPHLIKYNIIKLNINTQGETSSPSQVKKTSFSPLGASVIKAFEVVDPKNKTYYNNKTQRASSDFLVNEYGLDQVLKIISILPQTNKMPFFPKINSPDELKEKWIKLQDAVESSKKQKQNNKNYI